MTKNGNSVNSMASAARTKINGVFASVQRSMSRASTFDDEGDNVIDDNGSCLSQMRKRGYPNNAVADGPSHQQTIESMLRTMFGSCTVGMMGGDGDDRIPPNPVVADGDHHHRHPNHPQPGAASTSRSSTSSRRQPSRHGSRSRSRGRSRGRSPPHQPVGGRMPIPNVSAEQHDECYYAQFYADDHARAARAVLALREKEEEERRRRFLDSSSVASSPGREREGEEFRQRDSGGSRSRASSSSRTPTKSRRRLPSRESEDKPVLPVQIQEAVSSNTFAFPDETSVAEESFCYDDGISALSAHTLEEMAKREAIGGRLDLRREHSEVSQEGFDVTMDTTMTTESTLFPASPVASSEKDDRSRNGQEAARSRSPKVKQQQHGSDAGTDVREGGDVLGSPPAPFNLTKGRSHHTWGSAGNRTQSTMSTMQSNEFENAWRKNEQKYWEEEVEKEGNDRRSNPQSASPGGFSQKHAEFMEKAERLKRLSKIHLGEMDDPKGGENQGIVTPSTSGSSGDPFPLTSRSSDNNPFPSTSASTTSPFDPFDTRHPHDASLALEASDLAPHRKGGRRKTRRQKMKSRGGLIRQLRRSGFAHHEMEDDESDDYSFVSGPEIALTETRGEI